MDHQQYMASYGSMNPQDLFSLQHMSNAPHPDSFVCPLDMTRSETGSSDMQSVKSGPTRSLSMESDFPGSPEPQQSQKKKRKSWGQVLPIPTTNLPPRKRAKTEAEKEQRKYERVQRNRAAAHQSRMRKQEEKDRLELENNRLKQDCQSFRDEIQRLNDELLQFRTHVGQNSHSMPAPLISREPSLTRSSPAVSSPDRSEIFTPRMSSPQQNPTSNNDNIKTTDLLLPTSKSHSAEMCNTPQWMLDLQGIRTPHHDTFPLSAGLLLQMDFPALT